MAISGRTAFTFASTTAMRVNFSQTSEGDSAEILEHMLGIGYT